MCQSKQETRSGRVVFPLYTKISFKRILRNQITFIQFHQYQIIKHRFEIDKFQEAKVTSVEVW